MTVKQVKRAKRKIAKPNYWKKRLRRMEQYEAWWTEQTYLYGQPHHTALYDLATSAKKTVIYAKRAEYYTRKVSEQYILLLGWRDIRRIVEAADSLFDGNIKGSYPTPFAYYSEVLEKLKSQLQ